MGVSLGTSCLGLSASWTWLSGSFARLGKLSAIISSNRFSAPFTFLFWDLFYVTVPPLDVLSVGPLLSSLLFSFLSWLRFYWLFWGSGHRHLNLYTILNIHTKNLKNHVDVILSEELFQGLSSWKGGGKFSLTGYKYQYLQMLMFCYVISPTNSQFDIIYKTYSSFWWVHCTLTKLLGKLDYHDQRKMVQSAQNSDQDSQDQGVVCFRKQFYPKSTWEEK